MNGVINEEGLFFSMKNGEMFVTVPIYEDQGQNVESNPFLFAVNVLLSCSALILTYVFMSMMQRDHNHPEDFGQPGNASDYYLLLMSNPL
jgi:hypothetical protein